MRIFDIEKPTCLRTDWSTRGVGYFLLQKHCSCDSQLPDCCEGGWQTTLAGSRFLSDAEKRYAAIEGEALAVAWSLEQTKYFTQGCNNLLVVTDHKPLTKIFGDRTLDEITNTRLFRFKQRTLLWKFRIEYLPGKTNHAADAASRYPSPTTVISVVHSVNSEEDRIIAAIQSDFERSITISWSCVSEETRRDPALCKLKRALNEGFSSRDPDIAPYARYIDSLYVDDDVILYNDRIVVPSSLRKRVLEALHAAHQGVSYMKARAQAIVFWPHMTYDIERIRNECAECNRNAPSQARESAQPINPPSTPFEQVYADYFQFGGHHYLVIGDRLSGWSEIYATPARSHNSGARGLIKCLRSFFSTYGVPEQLSSDGGPEFKSSTTREFLERWGINHRVSSAYCPWSNGRAEVAVKSAKRLLRANVSPTGSINNDRFLKAMLQLRNTPDPDCSFSPAEIVFGKPLRDVFSFTNRGNKYFYSAIRSGWRNTWSLKEKALRKFLDGWSSMTNTSRI